MLGGALHVDIDVKEMLGSTTSTTVDLTVIPTFLEK